jgi:hypothetical protein
MQSFVMATSSRGELVITTTKEPKPIRGRLELAIVPYTLHLPTELVEVPIVVFSTQVKVLEEHVTPKPIPLILLEIGVGVVVTLINSVTHAFEVFRTLDTVLKDTHVIEIPDPQSIHLAKHFDTINE